VGRVAGSVLRVAERDFKRALADPAAVDEGPRRELWAARGKGWVGPGQLAEINRLLARMIELLQQPRTPEKQTLIALSWVLAPLEPQSPRRDMERTPTKPTPRQQRKKPQRSPRR
jgi:hypothetical protein